MYLAHHGIKGQKWGVKNGPPYPLVKTTVNKDPKKNNEDIYKTLSKDEKRKVMGDDNPPDKFFKKDDFQYLAKTFVTKYKDVPVSTLDLWYENDNEVAISIMTRGGKENRGKGYGSKVTKAAVDYLIKSNYDKAYWDVRNDNIASIALAKKNGFKLENKGENWSQYVLDLKSKRK